MKRCPACSAAYSDDANVCGIDGTRLDAEELPTVHVGPPSLHLESAAVPFGDAIPAPITELESSVPAISGKLIARRYKILKMIGEGGFGAVFLAEDVRVRKRVVVKVLSLDIARDPDAVARFRREAIAATQIGHEGIVDVTDFDHDPDSGDFIVMEYLEGQDLAQAMETSPTLPLARALVIAVQVAQALGAAHRKGIYHRDLKPANVFLTARDNREDYVKILDFGISKVCGLPSIDTRSRLTQAGQIMGTPFYMSPEQCRGDDDIDHRADIYALGVMLYEMLTGNPPFVGENYMAVIARHLVEMVPAPSSVNRALSLAPGIDRIILRCLEKERARRYSTMEEMAEELLVELSLLDSETAARVKPVRLGSSPGNPASMIAELHVSPMGSVSLPPARSPATTRAPSTLGSASGEMSVAEADVEVTRPRPRPHQPVVRWRLMLASAGVMFAAMGAGVVALNSQDPFRAPARGIVMRRGIPASTPSPTPTPTPALAPAPAAVVAETVPVPAAPVPAPAAAAAAAAAAQASAAKPTEPGIRVSADIPGAEITHDDGTSIGMAPAVVPLRGRKTMIVVRAPGYEPKRVRLDKKSPAELTVHLEPIAAAPAAEPPPAPAAEPAPAPAPEAPKPAPAPVADDRPEPTPDDADLIESDDISRSW